jgi:hypothetical protein
MSAITALIGLAWAKDACLERRSIDADVLEEPLIRSSFLKGMDTLTK